MAEGRILIGTASWTDPSLVKSGAFYPAAATSAEARLRYYARLFPIVEVDSSYYALPSERNAQMWVERTPEHFVFNVKAFRLLTQHQTEPKVLPPNVRIELEASAKKNVYYEELAADLKEEIWRQFRLALEPLRSAGKLGAVLFQFPKWFIVRRASFDHLREVRERLAGYPVAIEFRHESWFSERHCASTLSFEREVGFCNVIVDEPQLRPGSIPTVWETTADELAMVRLHGRNARTWNMKGLKSSSERFDYQYLEGELVELAPPIRDLARRAKCVHVIFNNNKEDQGIRGAQIMQRLLSLAQGG
ncbi:MAG TPA: DUF72 domain-containing protein [Steroidobacter sp.]|jgi:uncharacterized protein YecE (DUF72 family)|nr:DUF72 domain-containing protein [Steroidobacter sp.]